MGRTMTIGLFFPTESEGDMRLRGVAQKMSCEATCLEFVMGPDSQFRKTHKNTE